MKAVADMHLWTMASFPYFLEVNLKCWETLQKCTKFEDCFSQLGGEWHLSGSLFNEEEYLCNLYG